MNKIKLNNGNYIPQIGYGTSQVVLADTTQCVLEAYKVGYRHFDTAQFYNNEYEIGQAIQDLPRDELFITTKIWMSNYNTKEIFFKSLEQSLARLNTQYVDLLLLHWPIKGKNVQAYQWLEEALEQGLTKNIGVSNFMINHLEEIFKIAKYRPAVNQIEFNPMVQQRELVKFCHQNGIAVIGYSNLMPYFNQDLSTQEISVLEAIANSINKTVPEVILRFVYQSNVILIPKSSTPSRMMGNLNIVNFTLSQSQMEQIIALDRNDYNYAQDAYEGLTFESEQANVQGLLYDKHFK